MSRYITKNTKSKTLILTLNQKPETRWVRMFHVWKDILKGVRNSPSHKWRKKVCDWPSLLLFPLFKKILCAHSNQLTSFLDRWVVENTSRYNEPSPDTVSRFTTFSYHMVGQISHQPTLSYQFSDTQIMVRTHINRPFLTCFLTHRPSRQNSHQEYTHRLFWILWCCKKAWNI